MAAFSRPPGKVFKNVETLATRSGPPLDVADFVAIVLSVLAPGLGHIVLGQRVKGVLILVLVVASCGVGYLISALIALDAYLVARARKLRVVGDWECFPESRENLGL